MSKEPDTLMSKETDEGILYPFIVILPVQNFYTVLAKDKETASKMGLVDPFLLILGKTKIV